MTKSESQFNGDSPMLNIRQLNPADFSAFWLVRLLALVLVLPAS